MANHAKKDRPSPVSKLALCPDGVDPELVLAAFVDCVPVPVAAFDEEGCPSVVLDKLADVTSVVGGGGADDGVPLWGRVALCVTG